MKAADVRLRSVTVIFAARGEARSAVVNVAVSVPLPIDIPDTTFTEADTAARPEILVVGSHEPRKNHGAILYAAEKATLVALDAIQLLGGNGYINDYPTGRLLRDAKLYEIGAGSSEIRRMLIGRELFEKGG